MGEFECPMSLNASLCVMAEGRESFGKQGVSQGVIGVDAVGTHKGDTSRLCIEYA